MLALAAAVLALAPSASAASWQTDGPVLAMHRERSTIYLGGSFGALFRRTPPAVLLATTGDALALPPLGFDTRGSVTAAVSDGIGGYYVAGDLSTDGTAERLVHLRADGTRDAAFFAPGLTVAPTSLAVFGSTVYVVGSGLPITAVDGRVGTATPLPSQPDGTVSALALAGRTLIVGGSFTRIGTATRSNVAQIDLSTGGVTDWAPAVDGTVSAVVVDGTQVVLGGSFSTVAGSAHRNLVRVAIGTGLPDPAWSGSSAVVRLLALSEDRIFAVLGGGSSASVVALERGTGRATTCRVAVAGEVRCIAPLGGQLYLGGTFRKLGTRSRLNLGAVDLRTAAVSNWNPSPAGPVSVVVPGPSGQLLAGGSFAKIGYTLRRNLAAVDALTGRPLEWNPGADRPVRALAKLGSRIYIGGDFRVLGGAPRRFLGALSATTGTVATWRPQLDGGVRAIAIFGRTIVVGGTFRRVGTLARRGLAAIGGDARPRGFDAAIDGTVSALQRFRGAVLVGGAFTRVGKVPRRNFAVVTLGGAGGATPLVADTNGEVRAVTIDGEGVLIGGVFTTVDGVARRSLARVDLQSHLVPWGAPLAGRKVAVNAIGIAGGSVYVGGSFDFAGGQRRSGLAAFVRSSGVLQPWQVGVVSDPATTPVISAIAADPAGIAIGGSFTLTQGLANLGFVDAISGGTGD